MVSVDVIHALTEKKACDSLAKYGVVSDGRRYPIHTWRAKHANPKFARGLVLVYKKFAVIILASQCNVCWTRMIRTKELSHIYAGIDPNEYETLDVMLAASRTAQQNRIPETDNERMDDEQACFHLAMELLIPCRDWSWQPNLRELAMSLYAETGGNANAVAERFRIPLEVADYFFSSGWAKRSYSAHKGM